MSKITNEEAIKAQELLYAWFQQVNEESTKPKTMLNCKFDDGDIYVFITLGKPNLLERENKDESK